MNFWADEKRGCSTSIRFMNHLHTTTPRDYEVKLPHSLLTTPNYSIVFPSFFCVLC